MTHRYVRSGSTGGAQNGTSFEDGYLTIGAAIAASTNADTIWVASDHAETFSSDTTWTLPTSPGLKILQSNTNTGSPTSGLLKRWSGGSGITVSTTTNAADLFVNGNAYFYGLYFSLGSGSAQCQLVSGNANNVNHGQMYDECAVDMPSTSGTSNWVLGPSGTNILYASDIILRDCRINHSSAQSTSVRLRNGNIHIRGLFSGSTLNGPEVFEYQGTGRTSGHVLIENFNLDVAGGTELLELGITTDAKIVFRNGKAPNASWFVTWTQFNPGVTVSAHNVECGNQQFKLYEGQYQGEVFDETNLVRVGGGEISLRFEAAAGAIFPHHVTRVEASRRVETTGSPVTLTVPFIHDSATNLKNNEIWMEVSFEGDADHPLGVEDIDSRAALIDSTPADQPSDGDSEWDFTQGMTNPNQQKLVSTFTPQRPGYVHYAVCMATASLKIAYVDLLGAIVS